jgi:phage-related protein
MSEKKFKFVNEASMKEFMDLPKEVKSQFGSDLNAVQQNKKPFSSFKDISSSVGQGSIELIENGSPAYRTVYCAKYLDTVYILHSFTKTTEGVDRQAMKTAENRYKMMMEEVRDAKKTEKNNKKKGKN